VFTAVKRCRRSDWTRYRGRDTAFAVRISRSADCWAKMKINPLLADMIMAASSNLSGRLL
jgi:hypothetical protein